MASTQPGQEGSSQGMGVGQVCARRGRGSSVICAMEPVMVPAVGRIKQCLGSAWHVVNAQSMY